MIKGFQGWEMRVSNLQSKFDRGSELFIAWCLIEAGDVFRLPLLLPERGRIDIRDKAFLPWSYSPFSRVFFVFSGQLLASFVIAEALGAVASTAGDSPTSSQIRASASSSPVLFNAENNCAVNGNGLPSVSR